MFGDGPVTSESSASVSTSKPRLPGTPWGVGLVGLGWFTTRQYGGWFRNPATTHQLSLVVFLPLFKGFYPSQVVHNFFHQQYEPIFLAPFCRVFGKEMDT